MKMRYIVLIVIGAIAGIVGASMFGYGTWDNSRTFVSSSTAQVVAHQVQVGSINAGRIVTMHLDVGSPVLEGQVIATVDIASVISRSDITGTAKIGFRDVQDQRVDVLAPRSGVISARWVEEGDTMTAGQRIVTLIDPRQIWVVANIEQGDIDKIRLGQLVEVDVDYLDRKLAGRVEMVSPVTGDTSSLLPESSSRGGARNSGSVVPIRISLDDGHPLLIPGSSADVKIRVRQPEEG